MKPRISLRSLLLFVLASFSAAAEPKPDAFHWNALLGRGLNLGNMLESPKNQSWGHRVEEKDFDLIKEAGFQSVRIPIRWSDHAKADAPYTIEKKFFDRIDEVVNQALEKKLLVIINVHHYRQLMAQPAEHEARLLGLWDQIAAHYADYPGELLFEILNEPSKSLTSPLWNPMQMAAIKRIRKTNPDRAILVAPAGFNTIEQLENLELPEDDQNLIASFHYYRPFHFTHQGASWVGKKSKKWLGTFWAGTPDERKEVRADLDRAVRWASDQQVPLHMGEFGAYEKADMASRVSWTTFLRKEAEKRNISWAYWDYCAGFGVYDKKKGKWHSGLLNALLPWNEQMEFIRLHEEAGRTRLIGADGKPFFAHGITHINSQHGEELLEIGRACRELGFNAYGYGCPWKLKSDMPYLEGRNVIPMSSYRKADGSFDFVDIFDPFEQARLEAEVRKLCFANRKNPNLIGYCWTDLGAWPLENSTGKNWVDYIRSLPPTSAGYQKYLEFLASRKDMGDQDRDLAFLRVIAREYFRVLGEATRQHDPYHLIFGDRFAFSSIVPEVLEEMLPYVDAIAIQPPFQPGFPKADFDRVHELTGKPIIICDFAIRFKEGDKPVRGWNPQATAGEAGAHYADYIRAAVDTGYILGAFWCNPVDSAPGFKKKGIKQGLFDQGLKPRPELHEAIRKLNLELAL